MLFSRAAAVRTSEQIAIMRRAGLVVAEMHERIRAGINAVVPDATLVHLDVTPVAGPALEGLARLGQTATAARRSASAIAL